MAVVNASGRKKKLGEIIAQQLIKDIIARGWKAGENIGTEAELVAHYEISRATFREAVRQVERHRAARMRRGAGGGLIVAEPPRGAVVRAMTTYLDLTRVSFADQHEVRDVLELAASRLAAQRITPAKAAGLRALIQDLMPVTDYAGSVTKNMQVRVAVAEASDNPALPLFIEALNGVLFHILKVLRVDESAFVRDRAQSAQFKRNHVEAIIAGDADLAESLVRDDVRRRLLAMSEMLAGPTGKSAVVDYAESLPDWWTTNQGPVKLSEQIALRIVEDLVLAGWEEGKNLGNELALQARYKVSRAVLREAIRQLELHGIVRMKSGLQGGLIIHAPDPEYTIHLVSIYFRSTNIAMLELWEVQSTLETHAAGRAAEMIRDGDSEALHAALAQMKDANVENFLEQSSKLHSLIGGMTRNRAMSLFIDILMDLVLATPQPVDPASLPWLLQAHKRLVDAIVARNSAAARENMATIFSRSLRWIGAG